MTGMLFRAEYLFQSSCESRQQRFQQTCTRWLLQFSHVIWKKEGQGKTWESAELKPSAWQRVVRPGP